MKQIVCFGDSNTGGLEGESVRVIEQGLCGRTTVFVDPLWEGRKALDFIAVFPTAFYSVKFNN